VIAVDTWSVRFVWGGYAFGMDGPVLPATESFGGPFDTGEQAMDCARQTFLASVTYPNPRRILSNAYLGHGDSETPLSLAELGVRGELWWEPEVPG
jgi:hypothetical protein